MHAHVSACVSIMVSFRRYVSTRSRGFLLISLQETKCNEKKKRKEQKKENYKKNQVMEMNKNENKVKTT